MNGAEYVVQGLRAAGVDRIFALCGNGLDPLLGACLAGGMPVVDCRNEQAAAYMADTWARLTGRLGVVAVSSGPGHTNALTGLANAWWDGVPVLLISGASEETTLGGDHFQELDQVAMAAPVAKYARRVHHVGNLPGALERAISLCVSPRPGPAHLTLPVDVLSAEIAVPSPAPRPASARAAGGCSPDAEGLREAARMLAAAERPFVLVGSGAADAGAWPALRALAEVTDLPVLSHLWDRGCVEEAIPQYVGVTNEELNGAMSALAEADVLLAVGARLDYRVSYGRPPRLAEDVRVIRVDADPAEIHRGRTADLALVGNPRRALEALVGLASGGARSHGPWLREVRARRDALREAYAERCTGDACPVPGLRICQEIAPLLRGDVTFLLDGGNIGRWAHLWLWDRHPSHWLTCGASGVVGWGVGGAVAARLGRPGHPVLLLSGDGAAGFNVTDIETALRFGAPYVMVVAHDAAWGIVADGQPAGCHVACELGEVRFDRLAQALGARGVLIEDVRALRPVIEEGFARETVTVIQVPTVRGGLRAWQ